METLEMDRIVFSVTSSEVIRSNISKVVIHNDSSTVEFEENGTLHDTRLGAFMNLVCGTCNNTVKGCNGHFGHIEMALPVLHPMFTRTTLRDILKAFCFRCYRARLKCSCNSNRAEGEPKKRQKVQKTKKKPLRIKMNARTKYTSNNNGVKSSFFMEDDEKTPVSIRSLHGHISKINKKDFETSFPQFNHLVDKTEAVFINLLLVIPTNARLPNYMDGWKAQHITRLYVDVLRKNNALRRKVNVVHAELVDGYHNELQGTVDVLFDTTKTNKRLHSKVEQNGGIRQKIDGKEGRIRMNLMGKRTEFSARTVLSGDPMLGINEIGIPESFATTLSVPIVVNDINFDAIANGKHRIKFVTKKDDLDHQFDVSVTPQILKHIEVGDILDRELENGDIVAVNRQPTLHRGSIIACYVRIFKCSTLRLNYSAMITLNADTDGDEINIHVPQDLQSRTELEELMLASTNIVCSQASKPLIGCTQDSLLGCFKLSKSTLQEYEFMQIVYAADVNDMFVQPSMVVKGQRQYTGLQVLEAILKSMHISFSRIVCGSLVIIESDVICGIMDKKAVGVAENSLIHHVFLAYGHIKASKLIHKLQLAANAFLDIVGFSVGIQDCVVEGFEPIHTEELDAMINDDIVTRNKAPDEGKLLEALGSLTRLQEPEGVNTDNNNLLAMIKSGSKASMVNFNQITRMVGQQTVGASRVPRTFARGTRTLPHFTKGDEGTLANGYVDRSFVKGLTPAQFFFHAMAGRVGIIDTSCKTADTGALYRRLVKGLERAVVVDNGDGSRMVKCSMSGRVIQFNYGEDDLDGTYMAVRPPYNPDAGTNEL